MIKINTQELIHVLEHTPSQQNILLAGAHGIGKSKILTDFYQRQKKMNVITFFLGQMSDPGDLIGLMAKNEVTGQSEFLPPYWWPKNNEPVVLFLDEMNRARPEILQSIMDLALNRTLAGKSLPQGSIVISAINHGDQYQITDLDPALVSRFNIYEFSPTHEDWLTWAAQNKIDQRVIYFIQTAPDFLDSTHQFQNIENFLDVGIEKTPDRRAWERVSDLIKDVDVINDDFVKMISGIVGLPASVNFKKSIKEIAKLSPEKILFGFTMAMMKGLKLQDYILANDQIIQFIHAQDYDKKKVSLLLKNLTKYIQYLKKEKFQEAVAHFASQLENPIYEKVLVMVFNGPDTLMDEISDYIENIDL